MNKAQRIVLILAALALCFLLICFPVTYASGGWDWIWHYPEPNQVAEARLHDLFFQVLAIAGLLWLAFKTRD